MNKIEQLTMKGLVSFVVDDIAEQYYRAELLLFSLEKFGGVPRDRILVQCVDRVSQDFLEFLQHHGYTYRLVSPCFDGDNCTRLQQLEGIESYLANADGVYLLDLDLVVLAPFAVPDNQQIWGKIVDLSDLPLPVLERIFSAAGIGLPTLVSTDCDQGKTPSSHFDSGLLFLPVNIIQTLSAEWRKWASWLLQRPELFDTAQQRMCFDRVSLSMAIAARSLNAMQLPANFNFPLHQKIRPASFLPDQPLRILHHHHQIDQFGRIFAAASDGGAVDKPLATFNAAVAAQGRFVFFDAYKRHLAESVRQMTMPVREGALHQLLANHKWNEQPRRRLILHAGTPKTGTTSLQFHLNENRPMLQSQGILYPSITEMPAASVPKHQWLIDCLLSGNEAQLARNMSAVLDELTPDIHTIILSTEGIFNHWWDLPQASRAFLVTLSNWFSVEVWVWFREPASFMKSYYLQKLCNPRTQRVRTNGIDLSMGEMLEDAWIVGHLDYLGFIREIQTIFGNNSVAAFAYGGNTVGDAMKRLGLPSPQQSEEQRHNVSLGEVGVNLVRMVNRYDLNSAEKEQVVQLIRQLDTLVAKKCGPFVLDEAARAYIKERFTLQEKILQEEFELFWPTAPDNRPIQAATTELAQPGSVKQSSYKRFY